jgi:glutamate decarboxylase
VFYENYLGELDETFTLNFSTGAAMVLAQYYNLIRFGHDGYTFVMETMKENSDFLAKRLEAVGPFQIIGEDEEQLPLVAFRIADDADVPYDEFDIAWQVSAERGWMLPAYTMPPKAEAVKMLRALVKLNLSRELVSTLADDIAEACRSLEKKGGASKHERKRVKTGVGY